MAFHLFAWAAFIKELELHSGKYIQPWGKGGLGGRINTQTQLIPDLLVGGSFHKWTSVTFNR